MASARWAILDGPDGQFSVVEPPIGYGPGEYGVKGPVFHLGEDLAGAVIYGGRAISGANVGISLARVGSSDRTRGKLLMGNWR
jgi:hypothetical protein